MKYLMEKHTLHFKKLFEDERVEFRQTDLTRPGNIFSLII